MSLTANFNPSSEGPIVKFVGVDTSGKPAPFSLRVKNPVVATELVEKLKKEVEEVKKA